MWTRKLLLILPSIRPIWRNEAPPLEDSLVCTVIHFLLDIFIGRRLFPFVLSTDSL